MDLFADVSWFVCVVYFLIGPGALAALLALVGLGGPRPGRTPARVLLVLVLLVCLLLLAATLEHADRLLEGLVPGRPWLCGLAGAAALAVVLAFAALMWPRRRALRWGGAGVLLVVVVLGGWLAVDVRAAMFAEFFWRDGDTLVRLAPDGQTAQRMAEPLDRYTIAIYLSSLATLVAAPLLAAARLRARLDEGPRVATAAAIAAVALPATLLGEAVLVHLLSCLNTNGCAPMTPVDPVPDLVRMWTRLAEQRVVVLGAGLFACGLGTIAAVQLGRAGVAAGNRRLLAALAVFLVGGAAFLKTRAHADDTANGPRQAFVGTPFQPFGEIASDWTHPDFITPPDGPCTPLQGETRAVLVVSASGERVVDEQEDDYPDPRGTPAWERALVHVLRGDEQLSERLGRPTPPRIVEAAIDEAAPLARILPYLRVATVNAVAEVVIVGRRADVIATRAHGELRIDKLCKLGSLRLDEGEGRAFPPGLVTWGDLVRSFHGLPR